MYFSVPTLIVLAVIGLFFYYVGKKLLPILLEHDHDAVMRLLSRMDAHYEAVVATKTKIDGQRNTILAKISNAIKPAAPAPAPAADIQAAKA